MKTLLTLLNSSIDRLTLTYEQLHAEDEQEQPSYPAHRPPTCSAAPSGTQARHIPG